MNNYGTRTVRAGFAQDQIQVDASTQADLVGYESEDERLGRRNRSKRGTPYSKVDIREQYCINNKEVQVLESGSSAFFGCLSKHNESSCGSRHSFLSVCVGRAPSDENLHDIRRQPLPRRPVDDLERAYLRRRPKSLCGSDPGRYTWIPEDEEPLRLEHGRSVRSDIDPVGIRRGHTMSFSSEHLATSCPAHYLPPPPPPPAGAPRTKHVSFARSHTLTSFDDAIIELRRTPQIYKSQERLILSTQPPKKALHIPHQPKIVKKPPMKTQATQTGTLGREPPTYLSLSPRTAHRVKMVSQGAQTNGQLWNGRRLMKSYSEAGYHFADDPIMDKSKEHDALTRTQSEEPRSPYMKQKMALPWPAVDKASLSSLTIFKQKKKSRPSRVYKEIFIDFEPVENEKRLRQSHTNGEFVSEQSMDMDSDEQIVDRVDGVKVSLASFSTASEDEIVPDEIVNQVHSFPQTQDSVDEEFHENLVYGGIFNKFSASDQSLKVLLQNGKEAEKLSGPSSPEGRDLVPMATLNISRRASPFASSDSLTNDQKDHSDGIWNESQSTVLQAELDTSELSSRTTSKRQMMLLQHQQRSSVDTEILESDVLHSQSPVYSPLNHESAVPFVTIASVHQNQSPTSAIGGVVTDRKPPTHLGQNLFYTYVREPRRKLSRSPEKEEMRPDSGKATDISETSTTEDYATAYDNSGTDTSSRRSVHHQKESKPGSKEGSSFESGSSAPSFAREDTLQVVPSSPPTIAEENSNDVEDAKANLMEVKEPEKETEEKEEISGDAESSSSGSYSLDSGQREQKHEWTDQDTRRMKKEFRLDLSDHSNEPENWSDGKEPVEQKEVSLKVQLQKIKYSTVPTRRAQQPMSKKWAAKGNGDLTPKMVRSPGMPEGFRAEEWPAIPRSASSHTAEELHAPKNETEISSDESSCEYKITGIDDTINGHSPRRQRRRGGGRGRRSQTTTEHLPRRRPLPPTLSNNQQQLNPPPAKYGKSPAHSPRGSPRKISKGVKDHKKNAESPEAETHLKTLSAESLRSVSPGSDSVFYNEAETHLLCHQCGREFEGEPAHMEMEENIEEIVQPPAGFADSPENTKSKAHRLYKKQEKRFRSEERGGERRRHSRFRAENLRAKSEERGKEKGSKAKLRPHARSTDTSMELLRGADSSPSISEPLSSEEPKIYAESFKKNLWICVVEGEVSPGWNRSLDTDDERTEDIPRDVVDSTASEKEFRRKYQAATHRMVHRKSSMEMYRRLQSKSFATEMLAIQTAALERYGIDCEGSLRQKLEEVMRMMLVVWSTQEKALRVVNDECDKKVVVRRKSGEFGFRIHGSRPVVVSAIEPDTPAESSGLEVGDIVLSVNGVSVLEASHSDVVKLAHAGSDTLELEVARTSSALTPVAKDEESVQISGFLNKRGVNDRWHQRWFALKNDNCLYYYKSQLETQPIGALLLFNYKFKFTPDSGRAYSFILQKEGSKSLELASENEESAFKWKAYLEKAMDIDPTGEGQWFEKSCRLLQQPASSVPQPDCFGHLTQLEDKWRRRYCVLKDAALLLYADSSASRALAVACLQGYRVQSSGVSGKRFSFEVVPPESKQKHFYFYTDTEMDKKRWIAAIEYSIDRWMRVG